MTARADAAAPAAAADAAAANAAAADTGMIRRSPPEADEPYTLVNQLLAGNFAVMEGLPREEAAFSDNLGASRRISAHLGASRRISARHREDASRNLDELLQVCLDDRVHACGAGDADMEGGRTVVVPRLQSSVTVRGDAKTMNAAEDGGTRLNVCPLEVY